MSDIYGKAGGVLAYLGAPKATRDPYAGFLATADLGGEFENLEKASGFDSAAGIVPDTAPETTETSGSTNGSSAVGSLKKSP